jgi:cysteine desulfurase
MLFAKKRVYLDYAAAAPVLPAAQRAYLHALALFGNPSSVHEEGRAAKKVLEGARTAVARELEVKADDVIFTSGATEANNLAIRGVLASRREIHARLHVLYLPSAHASVVETLRSIPDIDLEPLPVKDGQIDVEAMKAMLRPETVLVVTDFVCGETGTVWNTREVKRALPTSVVLHVDAAQAPLEESCERTRIGADTLSLDAQKIGGVRGTGVLIAPRSVQVSAVLTGGGQERGLRSGTESIAGAAAFAVALTEAAGNREAFSARAKTMRAQLIDRTGLPDLIVNEGKRAVAHIFNISLIGRDTDYLQALLNEAGFAVSTKSACESDSSAGSRAVLTLTGDVARAQSTLRISWGPETSSHELERFSARLAEAVAFLDRSSA